jgi:DNA-binding HxlR family transcriptional regulator
MALFDLVGRRWTLRIIWELDRAPRPLTFRELRTACGEMSSSVLTRRLTELIAARIVDRDRDGYVLTPVGRALVVALQPVLDWSKTWARGLPATVTHDARGQ